MTLTEIELDALKETANIGTGNASIAMSNIFKQKVTISLPLLDMVKIENIATYFGASDEMMVGIYSKLIKGMDGNIMMVVSINTALKISRSLYKEKEDSISLTESDRKVLSKLGNAMFISYLTSLAKFFETVVLFSEPKIISTYGESITDFLTLQVDHVDEFLAIKIGFEMDDIKGDFLLLFTVESLKPLLESIDTKISGQSENSEEKK